MWFWHGVESGNWAKSAASCTQCAGTHAATMMTRAAVAPWSWLMLISMLQNIFVAGISSLPSNFFFQPNWSGRVLEPRVGENWLAPTGGHGCPFPNPPPPLLARRDGAMTTGIHSLPVPPPTPNGGGIYVRSIPVASHSTGVGGGCNAPLMGGLVENCLGGGMHMQTCKHEDIKKTKKAKGKVFQATGFEPRTSGNGA